MNVFNELVRPGQRTGRAMPGAFHSFENVTSLPRPTQKPRPPFWVATTSSPQSFANASKLRSRPIFVLGVDDIR